VNIFRQPKKPAVIPAQAGIQVVHLIDFQGNQPYELDSRLRGNDGYIGRGHFFTASQAELDELLATVVELKAHLETWLSEHHPELT